MKKQLLSVLAAITLSTAVAQTPSTSWPNEQNAAFTNTSVGIRYLDAVDQNVVWATGYDGSSGNTNRSYNWFTRTINGGSTYTSGVVFQSTLTPLIGDTTTFAISSIEGIDANTAWVCAYKKSFAGGTGSGGLFKTTNGGVNWVNVTPPAMYTNTTSFANFVTFLTPSVGIANGDPVSGEFELWRTVNGGVSWTAVPGANIPNPLSGEYAITSLYAKQGNSNVWYGTNQGRMFRTNDAGITWSVSTVAATTSTLVEIAFISPLKGVAYAYNSSSVFEEYNTIDGGATWNQITSVDPNIGMSDIAAIPGTNMYASCGSTSNGGNLAYSSDNGVTWTDWGSTGIQYLTIDFVNGSTGWSGGFTDATTPGVGGIWKYSGTTLTSTTTPTSIFNLPSYVCVSSPNATVVNNSTGSGPLTYSWSAATGATLSSTSASAPAISFPATANNSFVITLTVTNSFGTNVSTQVVNVINCAAPAASFTMPSTGCNNVAVTVANTTTASPAASYSWSVSPSAGVTFSPSALSISPSILFSTPGAYTVGLVATNASGSATATQTITIANCAPAASFTMNSIADGCADVDGSVATATAVSNSTGTGPFTYSWSVSPTTSVNAAFYGAGGKTFAFGLAGNYTVTLVVGNISGTASAVRTVSASICTGLAENTSLLSNLNIYPNPAHEQLNIALPASSDVYKIKMMNVIGAVVYEEKTVKNAKDIITINMANKAKGVYFLTVESNGEKAVKKIIVE